MCIYWGFGEASGLTVSFVPRDWSTRCIMTKGPAEGFLNKMFKIVNLVPDIDHVIKSIRIYFISTSLLMVLFCLLSFNNLS